MKINHALILLSAIFSMSACGGGGGGGGTATTPAPSSMSTASVAASSVLSSSSSSTSSSLSSSSLSSSASSVASVVTTYPSYNTKPIAADATGMGSTATQIASKMKLGFNIGNTLEATGCATPSESCWGNPKITKEFVAFVKQSGFNSIRLPTSWNQYANQTTGKIDQAWLDRVKEVVQYCVDNDVYVMVNIHWDGGWLERNITSDMQVAVNAKQKAFWEQIATELRDFDEHLIFASANEPSVTYTTTSSAAEIAQAKIQMDVLLSYHQTFIDAVRATGGKNANRTLIIQGPSTDVEATNKLMTKLPVDAVANRMMAEVHFYSPWNFTGMTKDEFWGNQFFYWGKDFHSTTDTAHNPTWGEEANVDAMFDLMKVQFVDKGIPVIVGEFGVQYRNKTLTGDALTLHLQGRAFYHKYVAKQALAKGLVPVVWDIGDLLDRANNVVKDQQTFDALIQGATGL